MSLDNKILLVTGGASGIGRATVNRLAADGAHVIVADTQVELAGEVVTEVTKAGGSAEVCQLDVAESGAAAAVVNAIVAEHGRLDGAFNNAGIVGPTVKLLDIDPEEWARVLAVNLTGIFSCVQAEIRQMTQQSSGGSIVNTASIAGLISAPTTGPYTVSKHAVVGLSETLYGELRNAEANVGVSVLCPAYVDTKIYAAERNRPLEDAVKNDPARIAEQKAIEEMASEFFSSAAMATEAVADQVFDAISNDTFYILTHPKGSKIQIEKRMHEILDGGQPSSTGPEDFPFE